MDEYEKVKAIKTYFSFISTLCVKNTKVHKKTGNI